MHWINMSLVTNIVVYGRAEQPGESPTVSVRAGDAEIFREKFSTTARAEQFAKHLLSEGGDGWIDARFFADLAAGRMK